MAASPPSYLVGIAGGSGSGKTTLAAAIADALRPTTASRLALDAYYRDRGGVAAAERDGLNFDVPEALDLDDFVRDLQSLRRGRPVRPPRYCFVTHRRLGHGERVTVGDVVLVEGILLLHDPRVRALLDLRLYVDVPAKLRLARRIARDTRERGRTEESVITQCRASTWPAHDEYVEPSKAWADVVLVNAGRLEPVAEVAATLIRAHRERRLDGACRVQSA
jgi:uridine kinase